MRPYKNYKLWLTEKKNSQEISLDMATRMFLMSKYFCKQKHVRKSCTLSNQFTNLHETYQG